jgi:putative ABC transport system permease protein
MGSHIRTRLASLFRRRKYERELDAELQFHIDMLTDQNVGAGMSIEEARRAALRAFGAVDRVKDDVRDTWLSRVAETLSQDVRYGVRSLRRNPGFALAVIVAMALGIGANTAIFSVVNGVLLRPLPYRDGDRLVLLQQERPLVPGGEMGFSPLDIAEYRHARSLEGIAEFHSMWFILLGRPEPERVSTGVVSTNFFDLLGVQPAFGRAFRPEDDERGAPAVLILSHKYWQRSFGADPAVVGKVFQMNDRPHEVIGVLPPVPQYPLEVDVYMPASACPFRSKPETAESRDARMLTAFGRVNSGVGIAKAQADLSTIAARLQQEHPAFYPTSDGYRISVVPLHDELTRNFKPTLLVLLGTAGFVLLIVCASVANLMLARIVRRGHELAVRSALGASRARLLRQLLTESTLLALAGGTAGLALASFGVTLLTAYSERFTPRAAEIQIDGAVLLYTLLLSIATGLLFGSVPAFSDRFARMAALREEGRPGHERQGVRSALIVVQVAASFMLLIGAGLTIRSVIKLQQVDPGFRTDNILTMRLDLNFTKYTGERISGFWKRVEERLKAQPGVLSVGGAATFPLNERAPFTTSLEIEGRPVPPGAPQPRADVRLATPDYFSTIGQPVLAGRTFNSGDGSLLAPHTGTDELVVIVNQSMARHHWPGQDPLGKRVSDGEGFTATVVGVVADARQQLDRAPADELYLPMFHSRQLSTNWLVRSAVDPAVMEQQIRTVVRALDPDQPVDHFRTLAEVRSATLESPRLTATLLASFGLLALVITAAGIAGVVAFSVNQRTQEFGIRMALGAQRANVLAMVVRQGLQFVLIGLAIGLAGALVVTRLLTRLLFGIEPTDGLTFLAVSMVIVAVAALACFVPARRAASVDPMVALRVG